MILLTCYHNNQLNQPANDYKETNAFGRKESLCKKLCFFFNVLFHSNLFYSHKTNGKKKINKSHNFRDLFKHSQTSSFLEDQNPSPLLASEAPKNGV